MVRHVAENHSSWLDDIPVCNNSGIGRRPSEYYYEDGSVEYDHSNEDFTFNFKPSDHLQLYGLFDGHNTDRVSKFAMNYLPVELVFGQLANCLKDDEVKAALRQAFIKVDDGLQAEIDELVAKKTEVEQMLSGKNNANYNRANLSRQIEIILKQISSKAAGVIALIYENRLFIANIGHCQAVLCTNDSDGILQPNLLTEVHTIDNESEMERLKNLGFSDKYFNQLKSDSSFQRFPCLRHFGTPSSSATATPDGKTYVTCDPFIDGSYALNDSCKYLFLVSPGLIQALRYNRVPPFEQTSEARTAILQELTKLITEEFSRQPSVAMVAQAVVTRIARQHHAMFAMASDGHSSVSSAELNRHEDMTLLIYNINQPLGLILPKIAQQYMSRLTIVDSEGTNLACGESDEGAATPKRTPSTSDALEITLPIAEDEKWAFKPKPVMDLSQTLMEPKQRGGTLTSVDQPVLEFDMFDTVDVQENEPTFSFSDDEEEDDDDDDDYPKHESMDLDGDGRVNAYVDFTAFEEKLSTMNDEERSQILNLCPLERPAPTPLASEPQGLSSTLMTSIVEEV